MGYGIYRFTGSVLLGFIGLHGVFDGIYRFTGSV